ncbi:MAG: ligase-associated DNA damage response exonuclease [Desulfobacterales bacterium]|nr:ligase-associated DNA damage response exonuclease [Desulfobacterales bacterium]MDJ0990173.1 ligase-associated DNA damage response exonuclease [Desulfobacterales bacterium]
MKSVLQPTPEGLYCPAGDFHIDPPRPVRRAVITHAHADHARAGSASYLCAREGRAILQARLGPDARIEALPYGRTVNLGGIDLSLHPAGHIRGSAQVRIAHRGHVTVVSGDYKTAADPTCTPLAPQRCHTFISESTFGLPIFKWPAADAVMAAIDAWWRENREQGRTSILFAYALGKAQRILAGLDPSIGPILCHGAVTRINRIYRQAGVALPPTQYVGDLQDRKRLQGALVIAPPSADHPAWMRRFPRRSRAFASGWMRIRGHRRRRAVDRGFVISDHSDWEGLVGTIDASGAEAVGLTHGYAEEMARWLQEKGRAAEVLPAVDADASGTHGEDA